MKQKLPFKFSYKVTDTFYAGEYPFEILPKDGVPKLNSLTDFGITTIIDLTQERLTQYAEHLPETCTRLHFPTIDYTCPDFSILKEIHTKIDEAERLGEKIYVHCKGGHDRTGIVVATYFVWKGLTPQLAKEKFYEVFVPSVRGRYSHRPLVETKWEILDLYQEWLEKDKGNIATKINLIGQPHHFVPDAKCPHCKVAALGVRSEPFNETQKRYSFRCMNSDCITNFRTRVSWEIDTMLRDLLGKEQGLPEEEEEEGL